MYILKKIYKSNLKHKIVGFEKEKMLSRAIKEVTDKH